MLKIKFMSNLRTIMDMKSIDLELESKKTLSEILNEITNKTKTTFDIIKVEKDFMVIKVHALIAGQKTKVTLKVKFLYNNEFANTDILIKDGELKILPLFGGG